MSNKILNGDFSSVFANWTNPAGGGRTFDHSAAFLFAFGMSDEMSSSTWTYKMCQQFSSNDEVLTATITVWAQWDAVSGDDSDGSNRFIVELEKPDTSKVELVDITKGVASGSGNILSASNIKSHMTQYGNYTLWLTLETRSASTYIEMNGEGEWQYDPSEGDYDNISIDMTVKKYKTVIEKIGSSGTLSGEASLSRSAAEIVGLAESYSTEVTSPTLNYETATESIGLSESYSKILKRIHGEAEVAGLSETVQAKRTQGNLETTYLLEDLTQWTEVSVVTTPWIKEKTEI